LETAPSRRSEAISYTRFRGRDDAQFSLLELAGLYLFLFVIGAAPLPFGSRDERTVAVWVFCLGAALCVASVRHLTKSQIVVLGCLLLLGAAFGFVLYEQACLFHCFVSPAPIWLKASRALNVPLTSRASVAPQQALYSLGLPLSATFSFALGLIYGARDRSVSRKLIFLVGWVGAFEAVYGIAALKIDPTTILWEPRAQYVGNVTGTFVNRNTAAAYYGSIALIWALILCERLRRRFSLAEHSFRASPWLLQAKSYGRLALPALFFSVSLAALFGTTSRAGIVFSLLALTVALALYFRRYFSKNAFPVLSPVVLVLGFMLLVQIFGGSVNTRFSIEGFTDSARLQTYWSTLAIIDQHFWVGTGLGTFGLSYPLYRNSAQSMFGTWDIAHSVPLQLASEMGVPFALMTITGWVSLLSIMARRALLRRHDLLMIVASLGVVLTASLSSLLDFSLQVPGLAIVVCGIFGCGVAESLRPSSDTKQYQQYKRLSRAKKPTAKHGGAPGQALRLTSAARNITQ
jgi:hypothetical protein